MRHRSGDESFRRTRGRSKCRPGAPYRWRGGAKFNSTSILAPLRIGSVLHKLCTRYTQTKPACISTSLTMPPVRPIPRPALINTNIASLSLVRYNSCGMLAGASWVVCGDREMGMGGVKLRVLEPNLGLCGRRIEGGGMYTEKKTIRNYDKSVPRCDV